ncbi:MAG: hypothetical protein PVF90_10425 [Gemmatimonadota bacterium]
MNTQLTRTLLLGIVALAVPGPARAQTSGMDEMDMRSLSLGGGWHLTGMAQAYPIVTVGAPGHEDSPLHETGWYLTQPAIMTHLDGFDQRLVLHTTLNFEALTQENGELSFGGWGEGFIDKRHPHTLLHELMLSYNLLDVGSGQLSLSAGKGFAPFGTADPMSRPGLKYPTNHHLSQILERWTVNAVWRLNRWSVEAGIFGGEEPEGPYDLSNIESFGDSWSVRLARRWGSGSGPMSEWEASASLASVTEIAHTTEEETTWLWNAALRPSLTVGSARLHGLLEASASYLADHEDFFSVLAEARYDGGGHQPYVRVEYASRPEYDREGASGDDFFRYHDHEDPLGSTRWLITTAAYAYELTPEPWSIRPFVEVGYHQVRGDRGGVAATDLYGTTSFWALSAGARIFLVGGPMRMGSYGVLDPMMDMGRGMNDTGM